MEWLASLWYEMVQWILGSLMELFNVDLSYFAQRVPVINDIATVFVAAGWALLIGNLAYQAIRAMISGVGIEAEEPGRLFLRTAMFGFLLLVSRPVCNIGFGISATVMDMLQVPTAVTFEPFDADYFDALPNAGWLIVIIINIVIQWQLVKLFFEVAERYVILCLLTYLAPLAFAMGGSKSTGEIFRGWVRMFASMCALMVFNLMFVKLVLSALSGSPNGAAIIPWTMLTVGIVRMAKKMDGIILRIGMNPAMTGDPLGGRLPGMVTMMAVRTLANTVAGTIAKGAPSTASHAGGAAGGVHAPNQSAAKQWTPDARANDARRARAAHQDMARPQSSAAAVGERDETMAGGAYGTESSFHNRYGAADEKNMRRVHDAISIDADDFADGESVAGKTGVSASTPAPVRTGTPQAAANTRIAESVPTPPPVPPMPAAFSAAQTAAAPERSEDKPRPVAVPMPDTHARITSIEAGSIAERTLAEQNIGALTAPPTGKTGKTVGTDAPKTRIRPAASPSAEQMEQAPPDNGQSTEKDGRRFRPAASPYTKPAAAREMAHAVPSAPVRPADAPESVKTVPESVTDRRRTTPKTQIQTLETAQNGRSVRTAGSPVRQTPQAGQNLASADRPPVTVQDSEARRGTAHGTDAVQPSSPHEPSPSTKHRQQGGEQSRRLGMQSPTAAPPRALRREAEPLNPSDRRGGKNRGKRGKP